MRVLYDHQIFVDQIYGGISRYFFELLKCYQEDDEIESHLSLSLSNNHYVQHCAFAPHHNFFPKFDFRGKGRIINAVDTLSTILNLHARDYDIFHPTYYNPYFLNHIGRKPFVVTVFDMIHEKFKEMFAARNQLTQQNTSRYKRILTQKASHIIAISNSTKQDLLELFNIQEARISVVHLGNSLVLPDSAARLPADVPEEFILFVGGRTLHKNFSNFIRAAAVELLKNKELSVVCVGGGKFGKGELLLFSELGIGKQVAHFNLDDSSLGLFYRKALFLVFPSLYEGFGIPTLEAFACDCPLLCSFSSSFPEVAGDAALYFDPNNIDSIHEAIQRAVVDRPLRSELIEKGRLRAKEFSLQKTALETKKIYREFI